MSSFLQKLKNKTHRKSDSRSNDRNSSEPQYSIQPHPAKSNDPADLQRDNFSQPGGGLQTSNPMAAHHARGPHVPSQEIKNNLDAPLTREQLHARAAELNK